MQNIRPFQIVLLAVFAVMGILSIFVVAQYEGFTGNTENIYGDRVVIWGTFDRDVFERVLIELRRQDKGLQVVQYIQKDARTFEDEFVNAIADGNPPDVVLIPHEELVTLRTKLLPIPYDTFSKRDFLDRFINGAEIFLRTDGVYALPFGVDPLVMYWNRDLFSTSGVSAPPPTWENFVGSVVPRITRRDGNRNILTSAVAFGEYQNITYAKEVLLSLMLQTGSRMIEEQDESYRVSINRPVVENAGPPMNSAVQFYTEFSNVNSPLYSWNRVSLDDRTSFLGENLALFFGYGSEYQHLSEQNPNLNFDVAPVPQGAGANIKKVYGTHYGFSIVRASPNPQGSYLAVQTLLQDEPLAALTEGLLIAPSSRALISRGTANPYRQVVLDSALYAEGWLDPDPEESDEIFSQMIDDIVSNRQQLSSAITDSVRRLELAF